MVPLLVTSAAPPVWSKRYWLGCGFNAAMHIRNWLIRPPFIMYYLTFLLPEVLEDLREAGFRPEVLPLGWDEHPGVCLVVATRD